MEQLVTKKFSDIFTLTEKELSELEGFKEKSIKNLLKSIEKAKKSPLAKLIMALGIRYVGSQMSDELAATMRSLKKLMSLSRDELLAIPGVGEKVATSLVEYFSDEDALREIHALEKLGVKTEEQAHTYDTEHPFYNKMLVLTGTLSSMGRNEASKKLKEKGARTADTVSKKIDFVVVGEDPGSKLEKAKKLGIEILDEDAFLNLLEER